jgi:hypothetical protein
MLKVYHYKSLTEEERKQVNRSNEGWDCSPRLRRYAAVTHLGKPQAVIDGLIEREYHLVAVVDSDDLEDGFRYTNHIDKDWTLNSLVTPIPGASKRSTSVGDIIVRDGATYIVASCGFTKLGEEPKPKPLARIEYLQIVPGYDGEPDIEVKS